MSQLMVTMQRIQQLEQRFGLDSAPSASVDNKGTSFEAALNASQQAVSNTPSSKADTNISQLIHNASQKHGVDESLLKALIQTESGFNPAATSPVGAQGLMQLMPQTAKGLGVSNAYDPAQNVEGGTKYLKGLISKYQSLPKALAAYNAGPGNVDKYNGIPPFAETKNYVNKVLTTQQQLASSNNGGQI